MSARQSHLLVSLWRARPPTNSPPPPDTSATTSLQHSKRARISSLVCPGSTLVTTRVRRHTKAHHRRDASSRTFSAERGDGNLRAHSVRSGGQGPRRSPLHHKPLHPEAHPPDGPSGRWQTLSAAAASAPACCSVSAVFSVVEVMTATGNFAPGQ